MRILIIIDSLGSGGAEKSTEVFCDFLSRERIEFEVLCLNKASLGIERVMLQKGYTIKYVSQGHFIKQARSIARLISHGNYTLVHSILFQSNLRTRMARAFTKFIHLESLVNTTYSHERFADKRVNKIGLKIYKELDRFSAPRYVDHFHSITETVKKHYINELGLNPNKISVISRGRHPILNEFPAHKNKRDKVQLINVGRIEFQKGQIYLLKAIKELKERGYKFHLNILGRKGRVTTELENYIDKNGLKDQVNLVGYKENVAQYLLESDLFIFPSLYEGLGGALIEAQAAGLPIVCNDIPVLHEVVRKNINAIFCDVHNLNSFVKAITFFLDNPERMEEFGKASLLNYRANFNLELNHQKLLKLYKNLC